jgi:hypothetical protein
MTDERGAFLDWWCADVPENLREGWKERVDQCLRDGNAADRVQKAWEGFQFGVKLARAASISANVALTADQRAQVEEAICSLEHAGFKHEPRNLRAVLAANVATAGQWVHCSPSLLNAGVSCANTPRRACECEGNTGHDHFIAHSTGSEA